METSANLPDKKHRIEYVDLLKGFTILWVVWFHMQSPEFVKIPIRMPLFFFISGIFFKPYPLKEFVRKKFNTLIVPFFFFYFLYIAYRFLVWGFFKVFSSTPSADFSFGEVLPFVELFRTGSMPCNPPLWFIVALLIFQCVLYCITMFFKHRKFQIISCVVVAVIFIISFHDGPGTLYPGLINFCFYAGGFLLGKSLLTMIEGGRKMHIYIWLAIIPIIYYILRLIDNPILLIIIKDVGFFFGIACFVLVFKFISEYNLASWLKFWGKNSYIVLGLHVVCLDFCGTVYDVVTRKGPMGNVESFCMLFVIFAILWCIIRLLNRYVPFLVGKKDIWKKPAEQDMVASAVE